MKTELNTAKFIPFLTKEELEMLTATKQTSKQIQWLQRHKYFYEVGHDGKTLHVSRDSVRKRYGLIN